MTSGGRGTRLGTSGSAGSGASGGGFGDAGRVGITGASDRGDVSSVESDPARAESLAGSGAGGEAGNNTNAASATTPTTPAIRTHGGPPFGPVFRTTSVWRIFFLEPTKASYRKSCRQKQPTEDERIEGSRPNADSLIGNLNGTPTQPRTPDWRVHRSGDDVPAAHSVSCAVRTRDRGTFRAGRDPRSGRDRSRGARPLRIKTRASHID